MSKEKLIIGAIAGDIIGSVYEWHNIKAVDFDLFCQKSDFYGRQRSYIGDNGCYTQ